MDDIKKTTEQTSDPAFTQIEGELKTRFELLPTELQTVILSSDYQMKLFEIAKKHKLTYEKLGQLELETTMVLLGMTPPDEYKADISDQLNVKGAELDELVGEINQDVFAPIREKLMGLYTKEEVELGEKFAGEKTAVASPDTSTPQTAPIPGINKSAVPTRDTNQFNSQKEGALHSLTPMTSDANKLDPYRELPEISNETKAPMPTAPAGVSLADTVKEHLSALDNGQKEKPAPVTVQPSKPTIAPKNQSETLRGIADLKSALLGDIQSAKQETPQIVSAPTPIVQKEEIIVPSPQIEPVQTATPLPNTFGVQPIANTAISLNNVSQNLPGETKGTVPAYSKEDTSELMRNIKLQIDETKVNAALENKNETMQKIDSMIDFKKAGSFMPTKEAVQEASTLPTAQKFTGDILDRDNVSGKIYERDIDMLGGDVKKTGFFGKLKNFFGNSEPKPTQEIPQNPNVTTMMPKKPEDVHVAQAPVSDADVESVKIFDEVTVVKK